MLIRSLTWGRKVVIMGVRSWPKEIAKSKGSYTGQVLKKAGVV